MAFKKGDNQYTALMTKEEALAKARQLFAPRLKGPGTRDWMAMWLDWCFTEPCKYEHTNAWVNDPETQGKYPGLHEQSIQEHGGKLFWKLCREAFRFNALAKVVERAPELLAKRLEEDLEAISQIRKTALRLNTELNKLLDGDDEKKKLSLENRLATLGETLALLAKTNQDLANNGVQKHSIESFNLHADVVQALKDRDIRYGVQ